MNDLAVIWNAADKAKRDFMRRYWPELADALDSTSVHKDFAASEQIHLYADTEAALRPIRSPEQVSAELHQAVEDFYKQQREEMLARPVVKNGEARCPITHGIKRWPYVARCVLDSTHSFPYDHIDQHGEEWRNEPCEGCKNLQRMEETLPPNDETAAYHFKRAARHHRKECPNR